MLEHTSHGHPFLERSGVGSESSVQQLLSSPEYPLDEAEKIRMREFATDLLQGAYDGINVESDMDLEELNGISATVDQQKFIVDYFDLNNEMAAQDLELLEINPNDDPETIESTLNNIDALLTKTDKVTLKKIAAKSARWEKSRVKRLLEDDPGGDGEFTEFRSTTVHYNPAKLLDKFSNLMAYRQFYKTVDSSLSLGEPTTFNDAQRAIVGMYQGRVRELIAGLYPDVVALARQFNNYPEVETNQKAAELLESAAPVVAGIHREYDDTEGPLHGFLRRLDYVRNGAALNNDQKLSPVASQIDDLVTRLSEKSQEILDAELPPEFTRQLERTEWDASKMEAFLKSVLAELGVLSMHQATWEEVDGRDGPSADGKFQVITRPGNKATLAVDSTKLVMIVPETFQRNLINKYPAGVLPVAAHEATHALQALVDREFTRYIPLAKIRGRRYLTVREGGGISQEQVFHRRYLGQDRTPNPYYYHALQAKLHGANRLQATRIFYDEMSKNESLEDLDEKTREAKRSSLRDKAIDSVARLYNRYEGYNSQPLNYIEQDLIASQLSELSETERNQFLLRLGSFNVEDAATLHKFGLYPTQTAFDNIDVPRTVMQVFLRDFNKA